MISCVALIIAIGFYDGFDRAYQFDEYSIEQFRILALISLSFAILSGYIVSILVYYNLNFQDKIYVYRFLTITFIYTLHFLIFFILFGSSFSKEDIALFFLGLISVVSTEILTKSVSVKLLSKQ